LDGHDCRFDDDCSDGIVLGGVVDPGNELIEEEDLLSTARLLVDGSVLKLVLDSRLKSLRKEGILGDVS
jgi:hypothetical protein